LLFDIWQGSGGCFAQVEFSEQRIAAMQEDRRILLEEATSHRNALLQRLEISEERLSEVETALQETAKNHILGKVFSLVFALCKFYIVRYLWISWTQTGGYKPRLCR